MSSKATQAAQDQKFMTAYKKYFGPSTSITVGQTKYTPAQVTSMVQSRVNAEVAVETTRGSYSQAVATAKTTVASTKTLYERIKQVVLVMYADDASVLAEFGLSAKKQPGPKSVAVKQAGIDQMLATRAARHTMGTQQRKKVKGVVASSPSGDSASAPATATSGTAGSGVSPATTVATVVGGNVVPSGTTGH